MEQNTKEENLKPKESENCLQFQKYLKIIPKYIPYFSGRISWYHGACGIFLGEYLLKYTRFHFSLLQLSVLVNTKQKENGSDPINMKNYHNIFSDIVEYIYHCPVEPLIFFMGEYWLIYAHFYFTCLRFSVLVTTKQQKNI